MYPRRTDLGNYGANEHQNLCPSSAWAGSKPYLIGTDVRGQMLIGERRPDGKNCGFVQVAKAVQEHP